VLLLNRGEVHLNPRGDELFQWQRQGVPQLWSLRVAGTVVPLLPRPGEPGRTCCAFPSSFYLTPRWRVRICLPVPSGKPKMWAMRLMPQSFSSLSASPASSTSFGVLRRERLRRRDRSTGPASPSARKRRTHFRTVLQEMRSLRVVSLRLPHSWKVCRSSI